MRRLLGSGFWLLAALFLTLCMSVANAAQRDVTLLPGTDLPGFDYAVIKDVNAEACQAACQSDQICRAFTYNTKAKWCFLKGDVGPETPFPGAASGRIVMSPSAEALAAERQGELPFPADYLIDRARRFAADLPTTDTPPPGSSYFDLVNAGNDAINQSNYAGAMLAYRQALAIVDNDPAIWLELARAALTQSKAAAEQGERGNSYDLAAVATSAALNGFLQSDAVILRANALGALAYAMERREMWRETIATYRASLALVDNAQVQSHLDKVIAEHGFRVISNEVDSESASPRICAIFSDPLPTGTGATDLSNYVIVDAPRIAVETEQSQICIEGVEHGRRYNIKLRAGLPSADGESLRSDVELNIYVPDRSPFVGFANNAYVMPAGLGGGLPITSINAKTADIVIYRIGDRSIATTVRNGVFQGTLTTSSAEDVANNYGEKSWEGKLDLAQAEANANAVTAVPVADVLTDMQPGAYVITAKVEGTEQNYWSEIATQWFIVTDIGLTTVSGEDGVHAFVRSLHTAEPMVGVNVKLVATNNEILGEGTTGADGQAIFAPGLARGEGGRAPQLLVAETRAGDYAFLDVSKPAFDLTDRGVDGRPSPGPLDLFATTERGVYRPGETVFLTALLRDNHANAVANLPLTLSMERPDGVVSLRQVLTDGGAGAYFAAVPMVADAMRGSWNIRLFVDPKAAPLADVAFLVEDFEPERLAFEVSAPDAPMIPDDITPINVAAKYLYGATAPGLSVEADVVLRPKTSLAGYPGYTFGRLDDTIETDREYMGKVGVTDDSGNAVAELILPTPQSSTRPLEAQVLMRLVDTNGRTVERSLTRPVLADVDRIGIKPHFTESDGVAEGSEAKFDIIAVAPTGETIAKQGLVWSLSRVETNYQWYRQSGTWKWEAVTTTRRVADGAIDTIAADPVTIAAQVDWGRYRLEVESTGPAPTSTSYEFYAGYYYAEAGSDTPDTLQVALDKSTYRVGDTATLRLDPQFAGTALVMVVDDRIIDMVAVPVPAAGTSVALTVTDDWGPGAYVTAMLYRPSDAAEKRMPARALGLAFADVEPGDRLLNVALEAPAVSLPRQSFTTQVKLGNVAAGQKAYVAVAAVDLGILNLTNFKTPDPDGWYFGQRQLGMQMRDLYGQLIDPTQGLPGAMRSGGDGEAARTGTPPPTSVLVALHSGIVETDAAGVATVTFDMPDFAGTVRVMAMAWTDHAVGHSSVDVIVRDPVVVTLSPPRFLRLDDQSRLLVEVNNVAGPAGVYRVALMTGDGLVTDATETSVDLATSARTGLNLGLTASAIGDQQLKLVVTAPNGDALVKELTLGARAVSAPQTVSKLVTMAPGATHVLDASYFADLLPNTGALMLAVGPIARLDVPELLLQLDRYPYGCAEQVASRALPLLYLNEVAAVIGIDTDAELAQRITNAITNLLAKQSSNGGFGLWGPYSGGDLWLDAYVTEFLLRARNEGYDIPAEAMSMALDNLSNYLAYAPDFTDGGEDIAYALYDLARAGRATIGDLRYYFEARLDAFATPLAKAQLGAALALYGDRTRANTAFKAAINQLDAPREREPYRYRADYGSHLRDMAGVLALAGEFTPAGIDLSTLAEKLSDLRDRARYSSTQEDAWTLVAASTLTQSASAAAVSIDGTALAGTAYQHYEQEYFDASSVEVANTGNQPVEIKISVSGIPATPPPAQSNGFTITRDYYLPDGTPVDLSQVSQNDRFVVVLNIMPDTLGSGQYMVADPLPAGFEIENPDLSSASGVTDLAWLQVDSPIHVEARTDQYVAAFRYYSETDSFSTAYMVRAISPGSFALPGATVEDMYRPELRANTDAGNIEVAATGP